MSLPAQEFLLQVNQFPCSLLSPSASGNVIILCVVGRVITDILIKAIASTSSHFVYAHSNQTPLFPTNSNRVIAHDYDYVNDDARMRTTAAYGSMLSLMPHTQE
jgi:hypothetical protein